ncbi:hypothetical protein YC2023_077862 [Brassica napus]
MSRSSQFLDEADLPPALPEGVLPFYGSSPRRLSSVLNTVARTSLLDGPLKQLNKGGSRIAPFTVKRDANNHSRDNNDEVDGCVSQLKVIIKGDIVAAKQFGSEATESSEECEDSDIRKQRWTSFQFAEVTDLLKKTLGLKSWKCEYCGVKAVKLEKPIFGWVRKSRVRERHALGSMLSLVPSMFEEKKATDNGDNVIRGIKAKNSENIVESDDDSAIDEQSEVEDEGAKKKRGKSSKAAKEFKEHKKKTKINVLPSEVREILKDLWRNHPEFCSFIGDLWQSGSEKNDYAMFFLESILVPPTKFRPPTKEGDNVMEHPQTVGLNKVLESNIALGNARTNQLEKSKIVSRWMDLQESVNVLFDSKTSSVKWIVSFTVKSQREQGTGICQVLEKKEGLFRQKMMGKRVNHACRSVISPDPYIAVNDIGIPPCFALKLTYPEV